MLALTHTLISLPFGLYFQSPLLAFIAAFLWHLFADSLLHWNIYPQNYKRYPYELVALDVITGLGISYLVVGPATFFLWPMLAAIAGGNMPDILHTLRELTPPDKRDRYFSWGNLFFRFHHAVQKETPSVLRGLISQIVLIAIALWLIWLR